MSVCIAWKYEDKICIAADSRFTGGDIAIDCGIKVLECPVEIIGPIDARTGNFAVWYRSTTGLAFSGSHLAGYLVKERIAELLLKLQHIGPRELITFDKIADAAFKVYEHGIHALQQAYGGYGHGTDFFLVGRCPSSGEPMAFKFWCDDDEGLIKERALEGDGFQYDAIGAGSTRIHDRIVTRLEKPCRVNFMVLEELREMILHDEVPSVGGAIQYGHIEKDLPFRVFGVLDFRMHGKEVVRVPASRGVDLDDLVGPRNPDDLYIQESVIRPFQHLLDAAINHR